MIIRPAILADLPAIAALQTAAPEASQWNPQDYLAWECLVAVSESSVMAFLASRQVADAEWEILNLVVAPHVRRRGVARRLMSDALAGRSGVVFLEVRESNEAARKLYAGLGFSEIARRVQYYVDPPETAIVMKLQS